MKPHIYKTCRGWFCAMVLRERGDDSHGHVAKFLAAPITCVSRWAAHRDLHYYMVAVARYHGILGSGFDVFVHRTFVVPVRDRARWLMMYQTPADIRVYGYRHKDES